MKQCHAGGVCATCGAKAEADAEVTSRLTENGTKYIARFRNPNFKTQVKVIADAKPKPAEKALKTGGKYTVSGAAVHSGVPTYSSLATPIFTWSPAFMASFSAALAVTVPIVADIPNHTAQASTSAVSFFDTLDFILLSFHFLL